MKLVEYWPDIMREIVDFQEIAEAEQPEFDLFLKAVEEAPDDFFISTLTRDGVKRWEQIFRIAAAPGESLEERRTRLLIKYTDQIPYTFRAMLRYLSVLCNDFTAEVFFDAYTLAISLSLDSMSQINVLETTLREMVPANMILDFCTRYIMKLSCGAGAGLNFAHMGVLHTQPIDITERAELVAGAAVGVNYAYLGAGNNQPKAIKAQAAPAAGMAAGVNHAAVFITNCQPLAIEGILLSSMGGAAGVNYAYFKF